MTSRVLLSSGIIILWLIHPAFAEEERISEGRALFTGSCYRCHPLGDQEGGKIAPRIKSMDLYGFAAAMWNQSPNMLKAFESKGWKPPLVNPKEMKQIFLFTQVMADRVESGNPEAGKQFVERNRCLSCHSIGGRGGDTAPSWDRFANVLHPTLLMSSVWSHRRGMIRAYQQKGLAAPKFMEGDLVNLMAFMREEGKFPVISPVLIELEKIRIEPEMFVKFHCSQCHTPSEFAGHPERSLHKITEELLSHVFMPAFDRPPLDDINLTPEDSLSLVSLVYYYGHLGTYANAVRGKAIFGRHGCNVCHDEPDEGPGGGIRIEPITGDWELISRIFNKVPRMIETANLESQAFPRLTPDEMADIFAYLCASSSECKVESEVSDSSSLTSR